MYVCDCVRGWVHAYVRVGRCTYVCVGGGGVDGRSKVGTNEFMLITSRTHATAKEVRYPLVAFSIKTLFHNISMKTVT